LEYHPKTLFETPCIIKIIKLRRMRNREKRSTHELLVGKPEGKRPLGRPRWRWVIVYSPEAGARC
jgi:hypothetical protein